MFAAEAPQEPLPYGRWAEALGEQFAAVAETAIGDISWFPDRTWAGRTYVPATAPAEGGGEVFGYVSYTREHEGAQATDFERRGRLHGGDRGREPRLDARPLRQRDRASGAEPRAGAG